MGYTSKLRTLILLIAILPPIIIVLILKFSTEQKIALEQKRTVAKLTEKAENFILSEQGRLKYNVEQLQKNKLLLNHLSSKKISKEIPINLLQLYDFDFLAVVNNTGKVISSAHYQRDSIPHISSLVAKHLFTKENDQQGNHASLTYVVLYDSTYFIYAGIHINHSMRYLLGSISQAEVSIEYDKIINDTNQTILMHSPKDKIAILLDFQQDNNRQLYNEVLMIISIVTLSMMLLALIVGMYLTTRNKKEVDNLRLAFADVAQGNFDTTVMAYEQSEFSELADSFSEMVRQLKATQAKLSTVEKIAAWETVGRKLAHEIKNPLTPISIAADDLRSSYYEKLPDFDKTVDETTSTIKKEVKRMTLLLDEFVSFARMKHSDLQSVDFSEFIDSIKKIYHREIEEKKLILNNEVTGMTIQLDQDTFTQVLINLIKNAFESGPTCTLDITCSDDKPEIVFTILDNGPGFSEAKLANPYTPFETTKENGSGLGLVICHRIVLEHSGEMILDNNKNGGGRVVITLPIT